MEADEKGFFYPKILEEKCTECGLCERICPIEKPSALAESLSRCCTQNTIPSARALQSNAWGCVSASVRLKSRWDVASLRRRSIPAG